MPNARLFSESLNSTYGERAAGGEKNTMLYSITPASASRRSPVSLYRDSVDFASLLARIGLRCTVSSPVFYWAENIGESASELHARRGGMDMKFWRIVLCRVPSNNGKLQERKRDMVIFSYYIYDIAVRSDIIVLYCTTYISFFVS